MLAESLALSAILFTIGVVGVLTRLLTEIKPGTDRYDVRLDPIWLKEHMGLDFTESEVERFRRMDDPGIIRNIYAIARLAAWVRPKLGLA